MVHLVLHSVIRVAHLLYVLLVLHRLLGRALLEIELVFILVEGVIDAISLQEGVKVVFLIDSKGNLGINVFSLLLQREIELLIRSNLSTLGHIARLSKAWRGVSIALLHRLTPPDAKGSTLIIELAIRGLGANVAIVPVIESLDVDHVAPIVTHGASYLKGIS